MDWLWPNWKRFLPVLVLVSFAGLITSYFNSRYSRQPFKAPLPQENYIARVKRILFFTPFFGMADWGFGFGSEPFEQCPSKNCFVTNEGEPEDFDAILFHARNLGQQVKIWDKIYNILFLSSLQNRFLIREEDDRNRFNNDFLDTQYDFLEISLWFPWYIIMTSLKYHYDFLDISLWFPLYTHFPWYTFSPDVCIRQ